MASDPNECGVFGDLKGISRSGATFKSLGPKLPCFRAFCPHFIAQGASSVVRAWEDQSSQATEGHLMVGSIGSVRFTTRAHSINHETSFSFSQSSIDATISFLRNAHASHEWSRTSPTTWTRTVDPMVTVTMSLEGFDGGDLADICSAFEE